MFFVFMDSLVVSASQDAGGEDLTVAGLAQSVERLTWKKHSPTVI